MGDLLKYVEALLVAEFICNEELRPFLDYLRENLLNESNSFLDQLQIIFQAHKELPDKINFDLFQLLFEVLTIKDKESREYANTLFNFIRNLVNQCNGREVFLILSEAFSYNEGEDIKKAIIKLFPQAILKIRVRRMKSIQNSFTQILNFLSSDNAPPETKKKIESSNKPIFINPTDSLINEDKKIKDNLKVKLDIYLIDVVNSFIDPFFEDLYERFKNSDIFEEFECKSNNDLAKEIRNFIFNLFIIIYICFPFKRRYYFTVERIVMMIDKFNYPLIYWLQFYEESPFNALLLTEEDNSKSNIISKPETKEDNVNIEIDDKNEDVDFEMEDDGEMERIKEKRKQDKKELRILGIATYVYFLFEYHNKFPGYYIYTSKYLFPKLFLLISKLLKVSRYSISYKAYLFLKKLLENFINTSAENVENKRDNYIIHYNYITSSLSIPKIQKSLSNQPEYDLIQNLINFMVKIENNEQRMDIYKTLNQFFCLFSTSSRFLFLSTLIKYSPYTSLNSHFIQTFKEELRKFRDQTKINNLSDNNSLHNIHNRLIASGKLMDILIYMKIPTKSLQSHIDTLISYLNLIRYLLILEKRESILDIWNGDTIKQLRNKILNPYRTNLEMKKFQSENLMDSSRQQKVQLKSMNAMGMGQMDETQLKETTLKHLNDSLLCLDITNRVIEIIEGEINSPKSSNII